MSILSPLATTVVETTATPYDRSNKRCYRSCIYWLTRKRLFSIAWLVPWGNHKTLCWWTDFAVNVCLFVQLELQPMQSCRHIHESINYFIWWNLNLPGYHCAFLNKAARSGIVPPASVWMYRHRNVSDPMLPHSSDGWTTKPTTSISCPGKYGVFQNKPKL